MKKEKKPAVKIDVDNPLGHGTPIGVKMKDIHALGKPTVIPYKHLSCLIQLTSESFTIDTTCETYSFRCTADFITGTFFIHDLSVIKKYQRRGTGRLLFQHLLTWIRRFSLTRIRLYASGGWLIPTNERWETLAKEGIRHRPALNGYYTWGRFGFYMDPEDNALLRSWTTYFWCNEKRFPRMLFLKGEESNNWRRYGFGWRGHFDVEGPSDNLWDMYLLQKKLEVITSHGKSQP